MLNNGLGFSDEFEIEVCKYSEKSSSKLKQQYKDWATTMKKEGSAFFKSVKERANPAMKSAVKTVNIFIAKWHHLSISSNKRIRFR